MRVLFDNGVPNAISLSLVGHECTYSREMSWHRLKNGELILRAEEAGYDVFLSTDKNIRYQQNLTGRRIALVILSYPQWPQVKKHLDRIAFAVDTCTPGSYVEVEIPSGRNA